MRLLNKSDFDLNFDIKNLPELATKVDHYENPAHLMKLMFKEIIDLNVQLTAAGHQIEELEAAALDSDNDYLESIGQKPL